MFGDVAHAPRDGLCQSPRYAGIAERSTQSPRSRQTMRSCGARSDSRAQNAEPPSPAPTTTTSTGASLAISRRYRELVSGRAEEHRGERPTVTLRTEPEVDAPVWLTGLGPGRPYELSRVRVVLDWSRLHSHRGSGAELGSE